MAATKTPALIAEEQVGPKGWIRDVQCLELAADYDADRITSILRTAWASFRTRTPFVGTEAIPLGPEVRPAGMLQLREYGADEINEFVIKDHRTDPSVPSFAELKAQNFPNAAMDNDKMCMRGRAGEWPTFGVDRLATNMMQANLIKGGVLLNHLCFHAFGDAMTMWKLTELFAEDVRRAQGVAITSPIPILTEDREKLLRSTGKNVCTNFAEQHPEFIHIPFTPEGLPEGLTKALHHANVFRFTPEAIQRLKAECSPANVRTLKGRPVPEFISTNDAVTALLWRCVQRAEHPVLSDADAAKPSVAQVALDTRRRAHVPVHPHTLGNMIGYTAASVSLTDLVSREQTAPSLADLACMLRLAVNRCGSTYHDELAHYVENMDDVNRLAGTAFLDMPGCNLLQSNWSEFNYYGIEWGPEFGDHVKAVRFPAGGVCAGFQIIMPAPSNAPAGTVEVLVDVSDAGWSRLLSDEYWNSFAHNPTTVPYE